MGRRFVGRIIAGDGGRLHLRLGASRPKSGAVRVEAFCRGSFVKSMIVIITILLLIFVLIYAFAHKKATQSALGVIAAGGSYLIMGIIFLSCIGGLFAFGYWIYEKQPKHESLIIGLPEGQSSSSGPMVQGAPTARRRAREQMDEKGKRKIILGGTGESGGVANTRSPSSGSYPEGAIEARRKVWGNQSAIFARTKDSGRINMMVMGAEGVEGGSRKVKGGERIRLADLIDAETGERVEVGRLDEYERVIARTEGFGDIALDNGRVVGKRGWFIEPDAGMARQVKEGAEEFVGRVWRGARGILPEGWGGYSGDEADAAESAAEKEQRGGRQSAPFEFSRPLTWGRVVGQIIILILLMKFSIVAYNTLLIQIKRIIEHILYQ